MILEKCKVSCKLFKRCKRKETEEAMYCECVPRKEVMTKSSILKDIDNVWVRQRRAFE